MNAIWRLCMCCFNGYWGQIRGYKGDLWIYLIILILTEIYLFSFNFYIFMNNISLIHEQINLLLSIFIDVNRDFYPDK